MTGPVDDIADLVLWSTMRQPPTLGRGRFICVDGYAGSGKSTLGRALLHAATAHGSAALVHMDDIYEGWNGLRAAPDRVAEHLVAPLRAGRAGRYQRYDWEAGRLAEWHVVEPVDVLVLEGVGAGAGAYRTSITCLVWVDAPRDLRIARGVARDGEAVLPLWLAWMRDEDAHFAEEHTRERADVLVDGTGAGDPTVEFV